MVQSSHAAQYGLDTPTHPRALADQTYAINPKDHCVFVIASGARRRPATPPAHACSWLQQARTSISSKDRLDAPDLLILALAVPPKYARAKKLKTRDGCKDVGIRLGLKLLRSNHGL